jgi:hypothetical protein
MTAKETAARFDSELAALRSRPWWRRQAIVFAISPAEQNCHVVAINALLSSGRQRNCVPCQLVINCSRATVML